MTSGDLAELIELGGAGARVVEAGARRPGAGAGVVSIGVVRDGPLPRRGLGAFDILLCADPAAPRPWVGVAPERLEATIAGLQVEIARQPAAAAVAAQLLRMSLRSSFEAALTTESIAYSMLLASEGFAAWRRATPPRRRDEAPAPRVSTDLVAGALRITLSRPHRRNAFDAAMRDELCEALAFALDHPDAPAVVLEGEGPAFSAGGDLDEFGRADDAGRAHLIRTLRSPARLVNALGDRITARVHGACVGAGIEVAAAAGEVSAGASAVFRLPEVSMGLVPGAGGTATIARRIGRRRACYMAISGAGVDAATALNWGLVDAVEPLR
ncbi:MAG TPA: enoyl-CoA hydratase/isomerase family protein [Caulobacteraceae bacterium]|nr:enoyl-CoA hydratase/isomerase family protein [Caulobacteraceae bacterium]